MVHEQSAQRDVPSAAPAAPDAYPLVLSFDAGADDAGADDAGTRDPRTRDPRTQPAEPAGLGYALADSRSRNVRGARDATGRLLDAELDAARYLLQCAWNLLERARNLLQRAWNLLQRAWHLHTMEVVDDLARIEVQLCALTN